MKAIIIYNTVTGNTRAIAAKMKEILGKYNHACELHRDKEIKRDVKNDRHYFDSFELILLGSCTHGAKPALSFNKFIQIIKNYDLGGKDLICFSSSGGQDVWKETCEEIRKQFSETNRIGSIGCARKN